MSDPAYVLGMAASYVLALCVLYGLWRSGTNIGPDYVAWALVLPALWAYVLMAVLLFIGIYMIVWPISRINIHGRREK